MSVRKLGMSKDASRKNRSLVSKEKLELVGPEIIY